LWKLSRSLVWFVTFVISLILSSITILIGIITHNIFLLVWIVLLIVIWVILFLKRGWKKNQWSYSPSYD
jgi:hypothetical protein